MLKKFTLSFIFSVIFLFSFSAYTVQAQQTYGTYGCFGTSSTGGCQVSSTNTNCTNGGVVPNPNECSSLFPPCNSTTFDCAAPSSGTGTGTPGSACTTAADCATGLNCVNSVCVSSQFLNQSEVGTWFSRDFLEWYPLVYDTEAGSVETEIFGERYTAAQVEWIIYGWWAFNLHRILPKEYSTCIISNWGNAVATDACLVEAFTRNLIGHNPETLPSIPKVSQNLLARVFEARDISGITYLKEKLSIVREVKAQGFGFTELGFVRDLWVVSRNLAFSLMTLVIVILAFMIMFRMKTSPQTAISVQSAIPKIFISIILIAFSYAIAGFMIDLVYVFIGIFATMFTNISSKDAPELYNFMVAGPENDGLWQIFSDYMFIFPIALFLAIQAMVTGPIASFVVGFGSFFVILVIWILGYVLALWIWFRTIWTMLKALLAVAASIILAPFQILLGTLVPGMGFGAWLNGLLGNLAVFAAIGPMVIFALYFLYLSFGDHTTLQGVVQAWASFQEIGIDSNVSSNFWTPPLMSGGSYLPIIFLFMSIGIISAIPKVAEALKGFMTGRPISMGSAIGEALGPVGAIGGAAYGATLREPVGAYTSALRYSAMNELLQNKKVTNIMSHIPGLRNVYEGAAKAYKAKERF